MGFLVALIIIAVIGIMVLVAIAEEDFNIISIAVTILAIALFLLSFLLGSIHPQVTTSIIEKYKKGDYQLELKVNGDKIDTLYIFK